MWNFSTLQRPTSQEKERRRKYRDQLDKARSTSTLLPKGKVGRAKTFREKNNNEIYFPEDSGPVSLPASASMIEVLRHRDKSATRYNDFYGIGEGPEGPHSMYPTMPNPKSKKFRGVERSGGGGGFVSRLRFLDSADQHQIQKYGGNSKIRWQDREPSSGYSSGGRHYDPEATTGSDNDNIYGLKFCSIPPMPSNSKG